MSFVAGVVIFVLGLGVIAWLGRGDDAAAGGGAPTPSGSPATPRASRGTLGAMAPAVDRYAPGGAPECRHHGSNHRIEVRDRSAHGGRREIWVHRPPGRDRADIPVLYFLHGSTTTDRLFTLPQVHLGRRLDALMCRTGVPFVVAAPNGQSRDGRDTEWGDSADGTLHIETFVTHTVIHRVEGRYRRPRALRAIGGVSMGGFGAAAIALRHPGLYTQAACFAGYYHTDDTSNTWHHHTRPHDPYLLIRRPGVRDIRFFLVEGRGDHTPLHPGTIHGQADWFAGLLRGRRMTVEVRHPPGGHGFSESWDHEIGAMVHFLDRGWLPGR